MYISVSHYSLEIEVQLIFLYCTSVLTDIRLPTGNTTRLDLFAFFYRRDGRLWRYMSLPLPGHMQVVNNCWGGVGQVAGVGWGAGVGWSGGVGWVAGMGWGGWFAGMVGWVGLQG